MPPMADNEFTCSKCGKRFSVPEAALKKYPGWTPRVCLGCRDSAKGGRAAGGARAKSKRPRTKPAGRAAEGELSLDEVRARYSAGPQDGLFTDGSARPNPGPGGWGAVYVRDGEVLAQQHGHESHTTNNRMELMALIEGSRLVPAGESAVVYTDSELCFNTLTKWASGWEGRGWKRKGGPIKNLELVQQAYRIFQQRPELELRWIRAHDGSLWNEYADSLANAWTRDRL